MQLTTQHYLSLTLRTLALFLATSIAFAAAAAPQAQAQISEGPYYVGVPLQLAVVVDGFDEQPAPNIAFPTLAGVSATLVGAAPSVSSSAQIINGQVTRSRRVRYALRYEVVASNAGDIQLGPFTLTQAGLSTQAAAIRLHIDKVPSSADYSLRFKLPERTFWVGERIPVKLEWWIRESMANRVDGRVVEVPMFSQQQLFRFGELTLDSPDRTLNVISKAGRTEYPASLRRESREGEAFFVMTIGRTVTPLRAGSWTIDPARIVIEEAVAWQRNIFGARVATRTRQVQALSEQLKLQVQAPPGNGRPRSFTGIVGQGFSLKVTAERSIVNAGDPIRLTVEVRGDGALDALSLPNFEDFGLPAKQFRQPQGNIAGKLTPDGAKQFSFDVRPLNQSVREIPALTLAWFDPNKGSYQTTLSDALALSVRAAKVVGANDVVVATPQPAASNLASTSSPATTTSTSAAGKTTPTITNIAQFTNLAINPSLDELTQQNDTHTISATLLSTGYVGGCLLLVCGYWWRAHNRRDPRIVAHANHLKVQIGVLRNTNSAGEVANPLRALIASGAQPHSRAPLEQLLARCETYAFGVAEADAQTLQQLRDDAVQIAKAMQPPAPPRDGNVA